MPTPTEEKAALELEILRAQHSKLLAETKASHKSRWTEVVKVVSSVVVGLGGVVIAVSGYQLAEAKGENAKLVASAAKKEAADAKKEAADARVELTHAQQELDSLTPQIALAKAELSRVSDALNQVQTGSGNSSVKQTISRLQADVNAADLDLRTASGPGSATKPPGTENMDEAIQNLFAGKAEIRGRAFEDLISHYQDSPELPKKLVAHAKANRANRNGVYNSLVVLRQLKKDRLVPTKGEIKSWADSVKGNGPRTAALAEELLHRVPSP